jgi:hypothetical protein
MVFLQLVVVAGLGLFFLGSLLLCYHLMLRVSYLLPDGAAPFEPGRGGSGPSSVMDGW